ncbi:sensor histidine kinase [Kitasatospora phosalacinea]|uniref:histidine kinase n=1 Tax=Kitasatospora phosalacinea TaxID=2065 RepID=A0ABW6GWT7_9ACTN
MTVRQVRWLPARLDRWRERAAQLRGALPGNARLGNARPGSVPPGDAALALVLALAAFVPTLAGIGAQIGDLPERPASALGVGLVLAQALPLALRRRWPAACLAAVGGAFAVHQALGFATTFASTGLYLALYSAGAHQPRRRPALAAAAAAGYAALAVVLHRLGSPQSVPDYLAFFLVLAAAALLGGAVRARRTDEAQRRRTAAEAATTAERARIARELHDVVTHHVTAMVVQADAAQFLVGSAPERAAESMAAVSDTGRRALTELRYLLGVLEATGDAATADRAPADRAPTLGRVGDLVERARRAGQPVEFTRHGERRPHGVDVELAAYRVVQEALTNALKYAAGQPTRVVLRYDDAHLGIEVATDGPATAPVPAPAPVAVAVAVARGGGRGLAGLRERVRMLGGELESGPGPAGGFAVRATIPSEPLQE